MSIRTSSSSRAAGSRSALAVSITLYRTARSPSQERSFAASSRSALPSPIKRSRRARSAVMYSLAAQDQRSQRAEEDALLGHHRDLLGDLGPPAWRDVSDEDTRHLADARRPRLRGVVELLHEILHVQVRLELDTGLGAFARGRPGRPGRPRQADVKASNASDGNG